MQNEANHHTGAPIFQLPALFADERRYGSQRLMTEADFAAVHSQLYQLESDAFVRRRDVNAKLYLLQVTDGPRPRIGYAYPIFLDDVFKSQRYHTQNIVSEMQLSAAENDNVDFACLVMQAVQTSIGINGKPDALPQPTFVITMMCAECKAISITPYIENSDGSIHLGDASDLEFFGPSMPPANLFVRFRESLRCPTGPWLDATMLRKSEGIQSHGSV